MKAPDGLAEIVGGRLYSVAVSTLLADDAYWDGKNWERSGRNRFLYKTAKGNYFVVLRTQKDGGMDEILPLEMDEAMLWYERLAEKRADYRTAFDRDPEEA